VVHIRGGVGIVVIECLAQFDQVKGVPIEEVATRGDAVDRGVDLVDCVRRLDTRNKNQYRININMTYELTEHHPS
jgi:hypothetical protein